MAANEKGGKGTTVVSEKPKTSPTPAATTSPAATPPTPAEKPAKVKKPKVEQMVCKTEAEAIELAASREKGPRRAFKCKMGDKEVIVVGHNEGRAGGVAFGHLGGTVEALGVKARGPKTVTPDSVATLVEGMNLEPVAKAKILEELRKAAAAK